MLNTLFPEILRVDFLPSIETLYHVILSQDLDNKFFHHLGLRKDRDRMEQVNPWDYLGDILMDKILSTQVYGLIYTEAIHQQ